MAKKVKFSIQVMEDGEMSVVDTKGKMIKPISQEKFAKTLAGKKIKNAFTPEIVILQSNPMWICIGGICYYIP